MRTSMFQGDAIPGLSEAMTKFLSVENHVSFAMLFYEMRRRGFGQRRLADHLMWLAVNDPRVCDDAGRVIRQYARAVVSKYQDIGRTDHTSKVQEAL